MKLVWGNLMIDVENIKQWLDSSDILIVQNYLSAVKNRKAKFQADCLIAILTHPNTKPRLVASSLYTIAKCSEDFSIGKDLQNVLLDALPTYVSGMNFIEISNCFWALGKLCSKDYCTWYGLDSLLQKRLLASLLASLFEKLLEMSPKEIIPVLCGLVNMGVPWLNLAPFLRNRLVAQLTSNLPNSQETSLTIWSMAHFDLNWQKLDQELQRWLLDAVETNLSVMSAQNIANALWGLSRLRFSLNTEKNRSLIVALFRQKEVRELHYNNLENLSIISCFYYFKSQLPSFEFDILPYEEETRRHLEVSTSKRQSAIVNQINSLVGDKQPFLEELLVYGFIVDGFDGKNVLQIDGPTHLQPRQQRIDRFQNELLSDYGCRMFRITRQFRMHEIAFAIKHGVYSPTLLTGRRVEIVESQHFEASAIINFISQPNEKPSNVANGLFTIACGMRSRKLDDREKVACLNSLRIHISHMIAQDVIVSLWALSYLNFNWQMIDKPLQKQILDCLYDLVPIMSTSIRAFSIAVLSDFHISWQDLPQCLQKRFETVLISRADSLIFAPDIALSLWGLSKMKFTLNSDDQQLVVHTLFSQLKKYQTYDQELIIKLVAAFHDFKPQLEALDFDIAPYEAQLDPSIKYSPNKILPSEVVEFFERKERFEESMIVKDCLEEANCERSVIKYLNGVDKENFDADCILMILSHPNVTAKMIVACLNLMSQVNNPDNKLYEPTFKALVNFASEMTPEEFAQSMGVITLFKMFKKVFWGPEVRSNLLKALDEKVPLMKPQEVLIVFEALEVLDFTWQDLRLILQTNFLASVFANLLDMNSSEICKIFWILGGLYVSWQSIDETRQRRLLEVLIAEMPNMNPHETSLCLISLARMGIVLNTKNECLILVNAFNRIQAEKFTPAFARLVIIAFYHFKHQLALSDYDITSFEKTLIERTVRKPSFIKPIIKQIGLDQLDSQYNLYACGCRVNAIFSLYGYKAVLILYKTAQEGLHQQALHQFENELLAKNGFSIIRLSLTGFNNLSTEKQTQLINAIQRAIKEQVVSNELLFSSVAKLYKAQGQRHSTTYSDARNSLSPFLQTRLLYKLSNSSCMDPKEIALTLWELVRIDAVIFEIEEALSLIELFRYIQTNSIQFNSEDVQSVMVAYYHFKRQLEKFSVDLSEYFDVAFYQKQAPALNNPRKTNVIKGIKQQLADEAELLENQRLCGFIVDGYYPLHEIIIQIDIPKEKEIIQIQDRLFAQYHYTIIRLSSLPNSDRLNTLFRDFANEIKSNVFSHYLLLTYDVVLINIHKLSPNTYPASAVSAAKASPSASSRTNTLTFFQREHGQLDATPELPVHGATRGAPKAISASPA